MQRLRGGANRCVPGSLDTSCKVLPARFEPAYTAPEGDCVPVVCAGHGCRATRRSDRSSTGSPRLGCLYRLEAGEHASRAGNGEATGVQAICAR